jgi:hypothetical protein
LLQQSKAHLDQHPCYITDAVSFDVFTKGAGWMHEQMNTLRHSATDFNTAINYQGYGFLKYSICIALWFITVIALYSINVFLIPVSVLVFYFAEVHFLFLFPLLIDGVKNPVLESIKQTYRIGIFNAVATVFPIGCFMIVGLFNKKTPLRNWHTGSMAIIIWYQNEVRNRV